MGRPPFISNRASGNNTNEQIAKAALYVPVSTLRGPHFYI